MGTQWQVAAGFGGTLYVGLRYEALPVVLQEHEAAPHAQPLSVLMPQLRLLERAARTELNK